MSQLDFMEKMLEGVEVEWKSISEIFDLKNGYTPSKSNSEFWKNGTIPWFRMDDIRENGQILNSALQKVSKSAVKAGKLFEANSIIISTSATIGEHALITVPYLSNQRFTNLILKSDYIHRFKIKFLFYYCFLLADWCKSNTTMSSFASVDMDGFRKFQIPIPPINIQAEIVRILDAFTTLTAELTTELTARKKQYNYYRDQLLIFEEGEVEWKALGEVGEILRGTAITEKQTNPGEFPVVANGPSHNYYHDKSNRSGETIVIARSGVYAGLVSYWNKPIFLTDAFSIHPENKVLSTKFLYYVLKKDQIKIHLMGKGAGVPHVRANDFESYKIPVPRLEKQERIVAILDKFDALTNSITEGLPREITLRQQQYEYYRDLLLSFPKGEIEA
jgi:type I restriction enzyme S subunit